MATLTASELTQRLAAATHDPLLVRAAVALGKDELAIAERLLRPRLSEQPTDVVAIRLLAEVAARLGRFADSEALLRRALELAPGFDAARANLATVLHRQSKFEDALFEADRLLAASPADPAHLASKAAILVRVGGYGEAIAAYETILARHPGQSRLWVSYGHVLKTVGRQADGVAAYRRALALDDSLGDAWWSLANLKTVPLSGEDIAAMREALPRAAGDGDRYHLHFALGKALEDAGDFAGSFAHYAQGARLRRRELPYDPDEVSRHLERTKATMTSDVFTSRKGQGCPAPNPIFVVGLPRSGSTLIEQILASHSKVEGTMELPDITSITNDLSGRRERRPDDAGPPAGYLPALLALGADDLAALGRRYIEGTRIQRKTSKPFFVDKMPNNFAHIGLIRLILPNARIIDARRHPMATGFSAFKQHFSRGQGFTYDLTELGRYYRDYVEMMRHYDQVRPGVVLRVRHEALVADPETQIRRLLAHCGLPFEPACVAFHLTDRAVRTASSEQVRRPLSDTAVDHWRNYEPWLGPLREALGDCVDDED
ncbi:MAG: sulfotransferase [Caulobacteraceae bacterium]|nr:sulfotransferase [Caulobacteraceae bacterium]